MTKAGELYTLAERCEQTPWSGDRELDCAIYNAVPDGPNRKAERLPMDKWGDRFDDGWRTMWADREDKYPEQLKRYTASLDATIKLVADKDIWDVTSTGTAWVQSDHDGTQSFGKAATPALALCAAALRARASA